MNKSISAEMPITDPVVPTSATPVCGLRWRLTEAVVVDVAVDVEEAVVAEIVTALSLPFASVVTFSVLLAALLRTNSLSPALSPEVASVMTLNV